MVILVTTLNSKVDIREARMSVCECSGKQRNLALCGKRN